MNENSQEQLNAVLTKAASDEEFRATLIASPREVLISEGVEIPEGVDIDLQEVSESQMVVVLPPLEEG